MVVITFNSIENIKNSILIEENKNYIPNNNSLHEKDMKWLCKKMKGNIFGCAHEIKNRTLKDVDDEEIVVDLDYNMYYNKIAQNIVDDIVSCRKGQIYDDEIRDDFVNNYMEEYISQIRSWVDLLMDYENHLEDDNLTVKE